MVKKFPCSQSWTKRNPIEISWNKKLTWPHCWRNKNCLFPIYGQNNIPLLLHGQNTIDMLTFMYKRNRFQSHKKIPVIIHEKSFCIYEPKKNWVWNQNVLLGSSVCYENKDTVASTLQTIMFVVVRTTCKSGINKELHRKSIAGSPQNINLSLFVVYMKLRVFCHLFLHRPAFVLTNMCLDGVFVSSMTYNTVWPSTSINVSTEAISTFFENIFPIFSYSRDFQSVSMVTDLAAKPFLSCFVAGRRC